jgi:hypothetical protein
MKTLNLGEDVEVDWWREVLYNILIESGIPRKLVGPIKMCLNEAYSAIRIG